MSSMPVRTAEVASTRVLVGSVAGFAALSSGVAAGRYASIDRLRLAYEREHGATYTAPDDLAWRDLRAEVAAALGVHERSAQRLLDEARRLVHDFPRTLAGLRAGVFSERHAQIVVDEAAGLSEQHWDAYESLLLEAAGEMIASRFARYAAQVRASLEPEELIERHREAVAERRVVVEPAPHGMAWVMLLVRAEHAVGICTAVTGHARTLMVEGETRTLAQVKADVMTDLILDSFGVAAPTQAGDAPVPTPASRRGLRPEVLVHVPVLTAMGVTDDAAILDGYGPIDAHTARELCAEAPGFIRVLTDPEDGTVLSFGRKTYRPPAELKRYLRHRDEVCRFVGCTRPAKHCDIDHTVPWSEDGETVESNLAHLCRGHHRLKERSRWRASNSPGGTLTWTSPSGRTYETHPAKRGLRTRAMTQWITPAQDPATPPF